MPAHPVPGAIVLAALIAAGSVPAQAQEHVQRVHFAKGAVSNTIHGRITGREDVVYVVGASAGQTLSVDLKSSNGSNYFNITAPGHDEALFVGSTSGASYHGLLPVAGDYRIQVYLMRNAARRNETAKYTLTLAVAGTGAALPHARRDATVAGTGYQATATVRCAPRADTPLGACKAGVMRFGNDEATVEITLPDGSRRHIYFKGTEATSSDSRNGGFSVQKDSDRNIITVGGKERYEFPDAFVSGG